MPLEPPTRRRWPLRLRISAQILVALLALYGAAQMVVHRPPFRALLRERAIRLLETHLGTLELGPEVRVDWLFRVLLGPLTVPGGRAGDPPLLRVEAIRVRPDLIALVRNRRLAATRVRLLGVHLELPDRPGAVREVSERFHAAAPAPGRLGAAGEPAAVVQVEDLTTVFTLGEHRFTAGPLQVTLNRLDRPAGESSTTAALRFPGSGQGTLTLQRDAAGWHAAARFDGIDPGVLPREWSGRTARWAGGTISLKASGDAGPDLGQVHAQLSLASAGLEIGGAVVGAKPVGPFDLRFAGDLAWDARTRRLALEGGRVELPGGPALLLAAEVRLARDLPCVITLQADGVEFLPAVLALPPSLALPPEAPHPDGSLDARVGVFGPLLHPEAWVMEASLDLSRMREAARRAPRVGLLSPFVYQAETEEGSSRAFLVGPKNPDFVPISELPTYLVRAVTASEDAGFYGHSGFDFEELRNAAVEGAQAGRVVRGGSTISQQLAKNLYLSREKTLSRKLREAIVTVALEATVPKQRLMEIYLNVVEWGPGLWGIGPAARHWFGKDARELSPREAAFLARVIPGPIRYHSMWFRGAPSEAWTQHVDDLLRTMYGQGSLTGEELEAAFEQPIVFAHPGRAAAAGDDHGQAEAEELSPRRSGGRRN